MAYSEHSFWGEQKRTAERDCEFSVRYATGLGEATLKTMWQHGIGNADELARIRTES